MSVTQFLFALAWLPLLSAPARALPGNYTKDFEHPFVGLAVFYGDEGEYLRSCSGSLLAPTVFLTAGQCLAEAATARIDFEQDAGAKYNLRTRVDPVSGYPSACAPGTQAVCATASTFVNYSSDGIAVYPETHDVGLVILDIPVTLTEYGRLARAGSLDTLAAEWGPVTFTSSGYTPGRSSGERLMGTETLLDLKGGLTDVHLKAGGCPGDSGGPLFYGDSRSNTIVGVASLGSNPDFDGTGFSYRTDSSAVLTWILGHVPADEVANIQIIGVD
jgi:hypothetical protein